MVMYFVIVSDIHDNFEHDRPISAMPLVVPCSFAVHSNEATVTMTFPLRIKNKMLTAHVCRNLAIVEESSAASIALEVLKFFNKVQRLNKVSIQSKI